MYLKIKWENTLWKQATVVAAVLKSVKYSHSLNMQEEKELKRKIEDDEKEGLEIEQVAKRKRKESEAKQKWYYKRKQIEEDIKQAKATISSHDNVLNSVMERAIKATKSVDKNSAMETAKAAKVGIYSLQE